MTNFTNFKISYVIINTAANCCTFAYFFLLLSTIKMKFDQIQVYPITNIFNMILALCWRLETSPKPL